MSSQAKGTALISTCPAAKIIVECEKCGLRAKYDKFEMLEAGGDRQLTYLLDDIVHRKGCSKMNTDNMTDRCKARYANILT